MDQNNQYFLQTNRITKKFGGLIAIDDVSLRLNDGEIRGLIGPNGSGKTTIVNLITGIYPLNEGTITFMGSRIDNLKPHKIAEKGIMRTFQIARIFKDMTSLENLMLPALCQKGDMHETKERAEKLLDFALLYHLKDVPANNLSGGQKMLLQIVRGFMNQNLRLYILDEPFAGVHQSIKGIILRTIKQMNYEKKITFLIISHEMTTVRHICDQVSVLHKGKIISQGTMDEVAKDDLVIEAYLGG
jgi:branched-chain amino acid transport system ATP-binding protein